MVQATGVRASQRAGHGDHWGELAGLIPAADDVERLAERKARVANRERAVGTAGETTARLAAAIRRAALPQLPPAQSCHLLKFTDRQVHARKPASEPA